MACHGLGMRIWVRCVMQECDEKLRHGYFEAKVVPMRVAAAKEAEERKAALEADFRFTCFSCCAYLHPGPFSIPLVCSWLSTPATPVICSSSGQEFLQLVSQMLPGNISKLVQDAMQYWHREGAAGIIGRGEGALGGV